jgi:radical SAM superfamily enzyme YgiQ (UPF0313 family)
MKVLLVSAPYTIYGGLEGVGGKVAPLNLGYLASSLKKYKGNISVSILDADALRIPYQKLKGIFEKEKPDIVGVSAPSAVYSQSLKVCEIVRELNSNTKIIMGGSHPTAMPLETVKEKAIDFVVYGEGEVTLCELIDSFEKGDTGYNLINGIAFKDKDGNPVLTEPRGLAEDLDSVPFPARELMPMDVYFISPTKRSTGRKTGNMISSRGCPFNCTYCMAKVMWQGRVRFRSPRNVVDEIEECVNKYGIGEILFHDEFFALKHSRVRQICGEILRRKLDIFWACMSRAGSVNAAILKEMKGAGCRLISFGLESGSQVILNNIRKSNTIDNARESISLVKEAGIRTHASYMVGNIGETDKTMRETINLAKELNTDVAAFFMATPYPGTEFYKEAVKKGYLRKDVEWKDFSMLSKNKPTLNMPGMSAKRMERWQKRANIEYYVRLRYLFMKLAQIRNLDDILNVFRGIRLLFRLVK